MPNKNAFLLRHGQSAAYLSCKAKIVISCHIAGDNALLFAFFREKTHLTIFNKSDNAFFFNFAANFTPKYIAMVFYGYV